MFPLRVLCTIHFFFFIPQCKALEQTVLTISHAGKLMPSFRFMPSQFVWVSVADVAESAFSCATSTQNGVNSISAMGSQSLHIFVYVSFCISHHIGLLSLKSDR